jgi:hypothetical protein
MKKKIIIINKNKKIKNKNLMELLRVLDGLKEERVVVAKEKLRKIMVISELEKATLLEEISWRQKSRSVWLKDGEMVTNSNRKNNSIELLLVNGLVSSNQPAIREHIMQFYDKLFSEQFSWMALLSTP